MKGLKYTLKIYGSVLDYTHGFGREIEEIFLPEVGIAVNEECIFRTDDKRYKERGTLEEITVSEEDVKILQDFLKLKEKASEIAGKYLK